MDFMYLFLIAVGIVTILFIVGTCAYLHLNKRKNESDKNNLILVSKVTDIEDAVIIFFSNIRSKNFK